MAKYGKVLFSISQQFFASINKIFFGGEEAWAQGHNSMKFWDFPDLSEFPN